MAGNPNFDEMLATTLANYRNQLTDNIFTARPFQAWLLEKGRRREVNGGHKIVEQLIYAGNSTFGSYSGYEALDLTPQTGISAAEFEWRQAGGSIVISGIEEAKNNGEEQLIDLLEAKVMQLEETAKEEFDEMFFGDGTGNSSKDFLGLEAIVGDETEVATVGGIDCTDAANDWWRSYTETTATALTLPQMSTAYNAVTVGNDQPDLLLSPVALFEKHEALLQPNQRFTDPKTAQAGFVNLLFKGAVHMWDVYAPTGTLYFLNSKYISLVTHKQKWMKQTPFVDGTLNGVDAKFALIHCYGNLTVRNRARQGKLTGKTA